MLLARPEQRPFPDEGAFAFNFTLRESERKKKQSDLNRLGMLGMFQTWANSVWECFCEGEAGRQPLGEADGGSDGDTLWK